jgi:hypothetical protein
METTATLALLAETNVTVKRETGRGWVIRHNGTEINTHRGRKSDALSLAVVAALEIKDAMQAEIEDADSTDDVVIVETAEGTELAVRVAADITDATGYAWDWAFSAGWQVEDVWVAGTVAELAQAGEAAVLTLPRIDQTNIGLIRK